MPRSTCSWIKGILGAMQEEALTSKLQAIIAVTEGDCSNNHGLISLFKYYLPHLEIIHFSYPADKNPERLKLELSKLQSYFGVSDEKLVVTKSRLDQVRQKVNRYDYLQYTKLNAAAKVTQNILVSTSDFDGNYEKFEENVVANINLLENTPTGHPSLRLGYCGVPTIISDLFTYLESFPAKVIFFEVEKDFSMPTIESTVLEQYLAFRYPYDIYSRIHYINEQILERKLDGIIYYAQAFCHRQIDSFLIQKLVKAPVLILEGDAPGALDMRTKIRLESYIERLL